MEPRIADAIVIAVETTHCDLPVTNRRAVPQVQPIQTVITGRVLDDALGMIADAARNVVDRAGRRVGIENGGRATADDFDPVDCLVEAECLVAVEITQSGVMLNRHSIFEQREGTKAVHRDAACAHVTARLAAGRLHPKARYRLQGFSDAGRTLL